MEQQQKIRLAAIAIVLFMVEFIPKNSTGADGGPHSRVCAHLTLRSAPHRRQLNTPKK